VVVVFKEGILIEFDSLVNVALGKHCRGFSGQSLAKLDIVIVAFLALLDGDVALGDAVLVLLHLKVGGGFVGVVEQLVFIEFNGLLVEFKGLFELLLLVEVVALSLLGLCGFFAGNLGLFLFGEGRFFFFLLTLGFFLLALLVFLSLFLFLFLFPLFGLHLVLLHLHQVNPGEFLEHIHQPGVDLHELH